MSLEGGLRGSYHLRGSFGFHRDLLVLKFLLKLDLLYLILVIIFLTISTANVIIVTVVLIILDLFYEGDDLYKDVVLDGVLILLGPYTLLSLSLLLQYDLLLLYGDRFDSDLLLLRLFLYQDFDYDDVLQLSTSLLFDQFLLQPNFLNDRLFHLQLFRLDNDELDLLFRFHDQSIDLTQSSSP